VDNWDLSGTFADVVGTTTYITGTPTTITGLSSVTEYYFITPKYDAFNGTDSSRSHDHVRINAHANRAHLNPVVSTTQIDLAWGRSSPASPKYNTTNVFDTSGAVAHYRVHDRNRLADGTLPATAISAQLRKDWV
jgi:hypothetical protein